MENSKINYSEEKPKNEVKYDLEKIYSKILGKDYTSYKFNKIVLGTKRLISNNLNYNDFSKEYDDITKIVSFKYPNLDCFPISKNFELISLGKVRYSYDSTKKRAQSSIFPHINKSSKNKKQNLFLRPSNGNNKLTNIIKNNSIEDNKENDKIDNEFESKSMNKILGYKEFNKNRGNISSKDKNSSIKFISNYGSKKSYFSSIQNNMDNLNHKRKILIRNSFLNMINYKKYLHNNRMLLRDSLLNEKEYFKLIYSEDKIFSQTEHYNNFIKKHINLIKSNSLKIESIGKLEKIFEKSKFKKPKLILKPITIEFQRIFNFNNKSHFKSKEEENQEQIFEIPFEYTPIFYLYNFSKTKEILTSIFNLNKDYTSFTPKYENFSYLLQHCSNYEDSSNLKQDDFRRNISKKLQTSKTKNFQSLSLNKTYSSKINKRNSVAMQKEDSIKTIDVYDNDSSLENNFSNNRDGLMQKFKSKSISNSINSRFNKIYFCNKNSFEFLWLTPVYEYLVKIRVPEITFYVGDFIINKNIDIELLLFLLENRFNNWDFYTIEYLFSFYKFSLIINNFLSIYKIGKFNLGNNFMFLNDVINLSEEKKLKYSRKNYNFEYIFTDEKLNNYIKILHNYKILIFNKNINKSHQFCFHMNLIQMKALYFSIKKQGAQHLIKKIFTLDKDTMQIKINYDYLDNFCLSDFHNLENILEKDEHEAFLATQENKYNFSVNENKICLIYPNLESIKFINNISPKLKEDCFESKNNNEINNRLDFNILEKILKTKDLFIWPNIIEFYKDNKNGNRNSKNILENSLSLNKKFITMKSVVLKKRNAFE